MDRHGTRSSLLVTVFAAATLLLACAPAAPTKPNVVLIVVDDLGWGDLGVYGNAFHETPNIDRLAAESVRFTQAYASSPVCSPSRASLLTGRTPARIGLTDVIMREEFRPSGALLGPPVPEALPLGERTLGRAFRAGGYRTFFVGKLHLGGAFGPPYRHLDRRGFDAAYTPAVEPERDVRLVDEAIAMIREAGSRPFLLCLWTLGVHVPLMAPKALVTKYEARMPPGRDARNTWPRSSRKTRGARSLNAEYAAALEALDQQIGRLLSELERAGLTESTVVALTSDNGGLPSHPSLRGNKGTLYEGGIRVPLLLKWPGVIAPGSRSDRPVIGTDLYPTLLEIAGLASDPDPEPDGASLLADLADDRSAAERALYWHYPHYGMDGGKPSGALRAGRYKLIEHFEDGRVELFDLERDRAETSSIAAQQPERADALRRQLAQWRALVGAKMPTLNPAR